MVTDKGAKPFQITLANFDRRVFVDAFERKSIDVGDLTVFPPHPSSSNDETTTAPEITAHILAEYAEGFLNAAEYDFAHAVGFDAQNEHRASIGQIGRAFEKPVDATFARAVFAIRTVIGLPTGQRTYRQTYNTGGASVWTYFNGDLFSVRFEQ